MSLNFAHKTQAYHVKVRNSWLLKAYLVDHLWFGLALGGSPGVYSRQMLAFGEARKRTCHASASVCTSLEPLEGAWVQVLNLSMGTVSKLKGVMQFSHVEDWVAFASGYHPTWH